MSELLQDQSRPLSRWLSETPWSRHHAKEAAEAIERERLATDLAVHRDKLVDGYNQRNDRQAFLLQLRYHPESRA